MEKEKGIEKFSIKKIIFVQIITCIAIFLLCIFGKGVAEEGYHEVNRAYNDMLENSITGHKIAGWIDTGKSWLDTAEQIFHFRSDEPITWEEWLEEVDDLLYEKKEELEESSSF